MIFWQYKNFNGRAVGPALHAPRKIDRSVLRLKFEGNSTLWWTRVSMSVLSAINGIGVNPMKSVSATA
jgi:hypothetical protein